MQSQKHVVFVCTETKPRHENKRHTRHEDI